MTHQPNVINGNLSFLQSEQNSKIVGKNARSPGKRDAIDSLGG